MVDFLLLLGDAFWFRCFLGLAVVTVFGLFYNLPTLYEHLLVCSAVFLLVIGLNDLLFGFVHWGIYAAAVVLTVVMLIQGYIDENTSLGHELSELRKQKVEEELFRQQLNQGISDAELRALMQSDLNSFDDDDDDDLQRIN